MGTMKRSPLGLHGANDGSRPAGRAKIALAIIHAVVVLVTASRIERIAVRAIGKRRAFVLNRQMKYSLNRRVNFLPLKERDPLAPPRGMDPGQVQNLGRIQVADAGQNPLVEKRWFDFSPAAAKRFGKMLYRDDERIGTELVRAEFLV